MGFSRASASAALRLSNGELSEAVERLLRGDDLGVPPGGGSNGVAGSGVAPEEFGSSGAAEDHQERFLTQDDEDETRQRLGTAIESALLNEERFGGAAAAAPPAPSPPPSLPHPDPSVASQSADGENADRSAHFLQEKLETLDKVHGFVDDLDVDKDGRIQLNEVTLCWDLPEMCYIREAIGLPVGSSPDESKCCSKSCGRGIRVVRRGASA